MIERVFTKGLYGKEVEDYFEWKSVDVCLKNSDGEIIFEQSGCEFPKHYSQTACDIIASKYFYRGVGENSLRQVANRMAEFWADSLREEVLLTHEQAKIFKDEIKYIIYAQMWAPNSPQWFNAGVVNSYHGKGVKNDEGLYKCDEDGYFDVVEASPNSPNAPVSACYILSIEDKLIGKNSITDHYVTETKLFKSGSGCGTNFSPLRAEGEKLSSGGSSSGLMSYLKGLDVNAGTIKSGGTTRRAAKMVIVDVDHPEIMDFIKWKAHEEEKAKVLIEAGYDASIGGEAYSTVSGQNSNNTVRVPNCFMDFIGQDTYYSLWKRVDHSLDRVLSIDEVFNAMAESAWACGDPGIQFKDTINKWNTCKKSGEINASNPCGEFVFLDNTACNLSSINLEKFITDGEINLDGFYHTIVLAQLAMEASIASGLYPTEEIARNSSKFRPTGLGITGFAGALENLGYAYDDVLAREWAGAICSYMTAASYEASREMAKKIGPFEEYWTNSRDMKEVIAMHAQALNNLESETVDSELNLLIKRTKDKWLEVTDESHYHNGFRNAQVTCIAPTGTISFAMDASSTGIEPYFSRKTIKKLADGTTMEMEIEAIKTAEEIEPEDHVKMLAAIQPHISGAISKTVNLKNSATVDDIKNVFKLAYTLGCKSITVYRDGSKGTQVLQTEEGLAEVVDRGEQSPAFNNITDYHEHKESEEKNVKLGAFPVIKNSNGTTERVLPIKESTLFQVADDIKEEAVEKAMADYKPKRRKPSGIRASKTHSAKIGDIQLYITTGFYDDGRLAEIFANTDKQGEVVNGLLDSLSKAISHLLQYGIEPESISKILRGQKYEPAGVVERHPNIKIAYSISDLISKIIDLETGDYTRIQVKPDEISTDELKELTNKILEENKGVFESPEMDDYDENGTAYWDKWEDALGVDNPFKKLEGEKVYGERCATCGSTDLIVSGTCKTCLICGSTTGCG